MTTPARREMRLIPDLLDFLDMPLQTLRPFTGQAIRVEDYLGDDTYVVRAELPGIDPHDNLEISVARGVLTIRAERPEERKEHRHTEFRYGTYERHLRLPDNAKEDKITAGYDKGILTVTIPLHEAKEATRRITVEQPTFEQPTVEQPTVEQPT